VFCAHLHYYSFFAGVDSRLSDNFLLVADDNEIVQVDVETMNSYRLSIINVTSQPQVLAYDWLREDVYWTSGINASAIFKYSFGDETTSVVYQDPTSRIETTFSSSSSSSSSSTP